MAEQDPPRRPARPLFRPEAIGQSDFGEALAFSVPTWRSIALLGAGAAALLTIFGAVADFDRLAQVRGVVAPVSGVARVLAPQGGIVSAVYVRQGQQVPKSAPLLKIASPDRLPSGAAAGAEALRTYAQQQQATLDAAAADRERRAAERSRLVEQARELSSAGESYRARIALQAQRIESNEKRLQELAPLRAKGYISQNTILELEDTLLTQRQQLSELRQNVIESERELSRTRLRAEELAAELRRDELQSRASLLALERGAAGVQVEAEVLLAAPIGGTVSALPVSRGMAVPAGTEVAAMIRPSDPLEVQLYVPTQSAGSLRKGQRAVLRFDAFPYQRFGVGHGTIRDIASSATARRDGSSAYLVRLALADPGRFALRPDMTLTASIVIEERSLLDWLLAPLRQQLRGDGS